MHHIRRQTTRRPALTSSKGMVTAQNGRAAALGAAVLADGGNAADAAVAVSFALAIFEPWMSGLGGGGVSIYWCEEEQTAYTIDFGLKSSRNLDVKNYALSGNGRSSELFPWPRVVNDNNVRGPHAIAVPGNVAGLSLLHEKFGSMPWDEILQPVISAAKMGMPLDWFSSLIIGTNFDTLLQDEELCRVFLTDKKRSPSTEYLAAGDQYLPLPNLAQTIEQIARAGARDFYEGELAAVLAQDLSEKNCPIDREDLAAYKAALGTAKTVKVKDHHIHYANCLNGGPTLANSLTQFQSKPSSDRADQKWFSSMAESLSAAQKDRWELDGDISAEEAAPTCTTHFNVADAQGNMCATTQTILSLFGAATMSANTGIILNNGVMWFDPEPGKPNSIGNGKRCLMNVCPIIGQNERGEAYALGAAGGRKILSSIAQLVGFMADLDMPIEAAFHQPRIDCSIDGELLFDLALDPAVLGGVKGEFRTKYATRSPWPIPFAAASGIAQQDGLFAGCTDPLLPWMDAQAPG